MIIGLTGSFGAGKGKVVSYLTGKGFKHYSMSGFITEEIRRRNMPVSRDSMIDVGNDLRAVHGPTYILDSLYERAKTQGNNSVIEALRAVAEVRRMKELGGIVIGVDADPHIRYERTFARGSEKDKVSYEEWLDQEQRESNPHDPTKQDIFGSLKESDIIVTNDGSVDDLYQKVESILMQFVG